MPSDRLRHARYRRRLAAGFAVLFLIGLLVGLAARAWSDTEHPRARVAIVPVSGLDREVTIVHVSDLHGRWFGDGQAGLAKLLDGVHADAAVITGDLLVDGAGDRRPAFALAQVLREHADSVWFVPGNHDDARLSAELAARGVETIEPGRCETLAAGAGAGTGVIAVSADRYARIAARPSEGVPVLVIAMHQPPDGATLAAAARLSTGAQLVLAGHTHGGQVRLPLMGAVVAPVRWGRGNAMLEWLPELRGTRLRGLYHDGRQWVDLSAGLGTTMLPVRLFCPAELTLVRLVPASR